MTLLCETITYFTLTSQFQVSTSLFSTSKLPSTIGIETATKNVQLDADQLQSLKQSFLDANNNKNKAPSVDSSSNQDLDSGIISTKPGAGKYFLSLRRFNDYIYSGVP